MSLSLEVVLHCVCVLLRMLTVISFLMDVFRFFLCSLYVFRKLKVFRILICGGDGTFGWVLGALQDAQHLMTHKNPPSALLPLGTGE